MERSQRRFLDALEDESEPLESAVAAALSIYDFARDEPGDARLLVSLRREDLIQMPLPAEVASELAELNRPIEKAIGDLARRLFGRVSKERVEQTALAVFDLPYGALRRHLVSGKRPPAALRLPLARAVRAALDDEPALEDARGRIGNRTRWAMTNDERSSDNRGCRATASSTSPGRQDLDGLLGLYHRDVVVREPWSVPHGGVHRGLDQARCAAVCRSETWGPYQQNTDLSPDPEVVALNDDLVAARWRLRACDDAGEGVDVEAIDIYRLRDGKVLELETYYRDTAAMVSFLARASRAG